MGIYELIRRKYRHLGLRSLLSTSPRALGTYLLMNHVIGTIDRDELREIARDDGSLWEYGSRETIRIPGSPEGPVSNVFSPIAGTYKMEQPFVCEVRDCRLIGSPTPLGTFGDGRIILETAKANQTEAMHRLRRLTNDHGWSDTASLFRGAPDRAIDDASGFDVVFPLVKRPAFSYYHWLTEYLPKVSALEHYESKTGRHPAVLVEADSPGWLQESLDLAGVPFDRCVEWDREVTTVNRLVVGAHREKSRGEFLHPSAADYQWLRERIVSNAEQQSDTIDQLSDRVYVSRRKAEHRRVLNEDDVIACLEGFGFVAYELEDLSVATQVKLFSQAELVVGPHGAGLTNIVFADESSTLIDLINERHLVPGPDLAYYYYVIATQLGVGYSFLPCEPQGTDMLVDIDALESRVKSVTGTE